MMKYLLFIFTAFFSFYAPYTYSSVPAKVISIPRGAPVFVSDGVKTTAIVRGFAANDPARVVTQTIKKGHFLKNLRPGMIRAINPWYLASLAASGFVVMALEGLMEDLYKPVGGEEFECKVWGKLLGYFSNIQDCISKDLADRNAELTSQSSVDNYTVRTVEETSTNNYDVYYQGWKNGELAPSLQRKFVIKSIPQVIEYEKVTDEELWEYTKQYIQDNPTLNHSDIFKDADAQINEDFFQDPKYNPDANEDDLTLLDLYRQGHLQTTDPSAPYYVTPEKFAEIEALNAKIEKEKTPEGEADALNDKLKQPITQAEFEESTNKNAETAAEAVNNSKTDDIDKSQQLDDSFANWEALIVNPVDLPSALPSLQLPQNSPCRAITYTIAGNTSSFPSPSQCDKFNEAKKGIGYLLYLLTFMGIAFALLRSPN